MLVQNEKGVSGGGRSESVMGQDVWPNGVGGIGPVRDDPEASFGVVDDRDQFVGDGGHRPVFAEEIQRVVGVEPTWEIEGQVEVQQRHWGHRAMVVAFFLEGSLPGSVGGQPGGATDVVLVVPGDLRLEQGVGRGVGGDLFVGEQGDQAVLEGAEAAFDFAFGRGVGGDAVGRAQRGEGALELGVGVELVGGGGVAEERQAVGVEAGGRAVGFQERTEVGEVRPGGVAGHEGAAEDFAGVVVQRQEEAGVVLGGPPGMRRGIVLPEFADSGALPAAAGLGAAGERRHELGEVLANIGRDGGAGTREVEPAGQFVGQEGEVEGLAVGQDAGQEIVGRRRPRRLVIAAGRLGGKRRLVLQPLVAQAVELGGAEVQALGGGGRIQLAGVEGGEDFLDVERRDAMSELGLFILGRSVTARSTADQAGRSFSLWTRVEKESSPQRNPQRSTGSAGAG